MSGAVVTRGAADARETSPPRRWSPRRVAGTAVLAAWASLFWFLLLSGRDAFYLSSRTEWIVPVAAILLALHDDRQRTMHSDPEHSRPRQRPLQPRGLLGYHPDIIDHLIEPCLDT